VKVGGWKPLAKLVLWPLLGGWPDEGRKIVQGPPLRRLLKQVESARRVLNAGAGEGLFSSLLLKTNSLVQLVEIDYSYSSYQRVRSESREHLVGASLTAIPVRNSAFDLVLCTEVLEHIADDEAALDEIRRVLAPGGWLLTLIRK